MTRDEYVEEYCLVKPEQLMSDEEFSEIRQLPIESQYDLPDNIRLKYQATKKFKYQKSRLSDDPLEGLLVGTKNVEQILKEIRG